MAGTSRVAAVGRLVHEAPYRFRIGRHGVMRVPGVVYASQELLPAAANDNALEQVANVAGLPGIVRASFAMPEVHWGYGFPIGGVAATDVDDGGVVSSGGVGFDISCGVRLLVARDLRRADLAPALRSVMDRLDRRIPRHQERRLVRHRDRRTVSGGLLGPHRGRGPAQGVVDPTVVAGDLQGQPPLQSSSVSAASPSLS